MAYTKGKPKSLRIGSVVKGKEGNGDYISIRKGMTLLAKDDKGNTYTLGQYISLDSKKTMLETAAAQEEKGNAEWGASLREQAEKLPEFVRFELRAKVEG